MEPPLVMPLLQPLQYKRPYFAIPGCHGCSTGLWGKSCPAEALFLSRCFRFAALRNWKLRFLNHHMSVLNYSHWFTACSNNFCRDGGKDPSRNPRNLLLLRYTKWYKHYLPAVFAQRNAAERQHSRDKEKFPWLRARTGRYMYITAAVMRVARLHH